MNRRLTICMALALLVAAFLSGCSLSPASPASPDEATASLPQSEIREPETTAPAVDPDREARTTTPTCAPLAEEETMTPEATPQATEPGLSAGAAKVVQLAKEDLARKANVAPEAITLVSIDAVNWPDTSLGCPEPGMMYAQVITPGFLVVLESRDQTYEYHSNEGELVILCQAEEGQPH
ncbi:MAG: hypothetical protein GTO63_00790, partial [Anaerolineae bacterium]|nr:hypothetical protein [Anaerolineae bacterium]NIN93546.1 hypothetical protein [Anaerolineae bacterium]NIQ76615.1 hypothetical protein [Anaerolineae bacterium]